MSSNRPPRPHGGSPPPTTFNESPDPQENYELWAELVSQCWEELEQALDESNAERIRCICNLATDLHAQEPPYPWPQTYTGAAQSINSTNTTPQMNTTTPTSRDQRVNDNNDEYTLHSSMASRVKAECENARAVLQCARCIACRLPCVHDFWHGGCLQCRQHGYECRVINCKSLRRADQPCDKDHDDCRHWHENVHDLRLEGAMNKLGQQFSSWPEWFAYPANHPLPTSARQRDRGKTNINPHAPPPMGYMLPLRIGTDRGDNMNGYRSRDERTEWEWAELGPEPKTSLPPDASERRPTPPRRNPVTMNNKVWDKNFHLPKPSQVRLKFEAYNKERKARMKRRFEEQRFEEQRQMNAGPRPRTEAGDREAMMNHLNTPDDDDDDDVKPHDNNSK